jgi:hypothetical protein
MIEGFIETASRALGSSARWIQTRADRRGDAQLARRLSDQHGFDFTRDFVTPFAHVWDEHLAPFKGRERLAMLEIGSYEGRSAVWFLENVLTHPSATLTCVDPFAARGIEPRFDHNLRVSGHGAKVEKLKGRSTVRLQELKDRRFDIVYVDGDHRAAAVLLDAHMSWPLLVPGGVLIFDDYQWAPEKPADERPQMAVDLFVAALDGGCEVLHKGWQVLVRKAPKRRGS